MCGGRNIAGGRSKAMTSIDPKLRKALTGISGILVTPFDQEDKLLWPEHSVAIHAALEGGDYARANRLIGVMSRFEEIRAEEQNGTNVTAVKAALQLMGEDCGPTRPPSAWPLTENQSADLRALLTSWKLMPHLATAELKRATN
jgi:hypothetical protein